VPGTITNLGRTVTGVIVREGAPRPDIGTPEAFKQALRSARSVAYTDPKAGGTGGIMFAALLEKLGLAAEVNAKAVLGKGGFDVSQIVADGRAEIGTTFISEALPVKGLTVVGPLPGDLHNTNTYTAAVHARAANPAGAQAFLRSLTAPATRARWTAAGLEPAFPA
jgi:molybdate transport system substrate-binding protein